MLFSHFSFLHNNVVLTGRKTLKHNVYDEEGTSKKERIDSIPPDCKGKCGTCTPCVAVQVPVEPPFQKEKKMNTSISANVRADEYKPIKWGCKCSNLIFPP